MGRAFFFPLLKCLESISQWLQLEVWYFISGENWVRQEAVCASKRVRKGSGKVMCLVGQFGLGFLPDPDWLFTSPQVEMAGTSGIFQSDRTTNESPWTPAFFSSTLALLGKVNDEPPWGADLTNEAWTPAGLVTGTGGDTSLHWDLWSLRVHDPDVMSWKGASVPLGPVLYFMEEEIALTCLRGLGAELEPVLQSWAPGSELLAMPLCLHDWMMSFGLPWIKLPPLSQKPVEIAGVRAAHFSMGVLEVCIPSLFQKYHSFPEGAICHGAMAYLPPGFWYLGKGWQPAAGAKGWRGTKRRGLDGTGGRKEKGPERNLKEMWGF